MATTELTAYTKHHTVYLSGHAVHDDSGGRERHEQRDGFSKRVFEHAAQSDHQLHEIGIRIILIVAVVDRSIRPVVNLSAAERRLVRLTRRRRGRLRLTARPTTLRFMLRAVLAFEVIYQLQENDVQK